MPEDVVKELKRVAPLLGFSGYQPLIRAYIGQALRRDIEKLESRPKLNDLVKRLRRYGVAEDVISSAIAELRTA
jgi:HD-like signal output (HDOD) protein